MWLRECLKWTWICSSLDTYYYLMVNIKPLSPYIMTNLFNSFRVYRNSLIIDIDQCQEHLNIIMICKHEKVYIFFTPTIFQPYIILTFKNTESVLFVFICTHFFFFFAKSYFHFLSKSSPTLIWPFSKCEWSFQQQMWDYSSGHF